jgi:hypothetical protein
MKMEEYGFAGVPLATLLAMVMKTMMTLTNILKEPALSEP